ncbi:MAG: response regulator [Actinobacteria bacterium]|nr:response regulator [Actinomycetota bacterium]
MHILVATDADFVLDEVTAALSGPDTSFTVCRNGRDVAGVIGRRTPDLAILDLQIGSMGGMAVTMALRLDESAGLLPRVPVLMLLDRRADLHLAKRSAADGWVIKPLDALTLQRAVDAILNPPVPVDEAAVEGAEDAAEADPAGADSTEEEPATAG